MANVTTLQTATGAATGAAIEKISAKRAFQATLTCTSGNCTGTVIFEVSNDNANFITQGTVTFASAASPQTDGYVSDAAWAFVRSRVTAITGTGASLSTYMTEA